MIGGVLACNISNDLVISFSMAGFEFLRGLYCGACLDVFIGGEWIATRIERNMSDNKWYLVGLSKDIKLIGLQARI